MTFYKDAKGTIPAKVGDPVGFIRCGTDPIWITTRPDTYIDLDAIKVPAFPPWRLAIIGDVEVSPPVEVKRDRPRMEGEEVVR